MYDQSHPTYPKISVVTVVRNAESAIEKTIKSVISQDYPATEYIVVDGDSTDSTKDVLNTYISAINVFVSGPDKGIYDAMNKSLSLASGEWVLFMNAGDTFYNSKALSKLTPALCSNADVILAGISEILVDDLEKRIFKRFPRPLKNIWYQMPTSHQSTLVRLETLKQYKFDTRFKWCADHDLLARLYRDGKVFSVQNSMLSSFDCASSGNHRKPQIYIKERWQISKGIAPFYKRVFRFGYELYHVEIWGRIVPILKLFMSESFILKLRKIRGTSGS